MCPTASRWNSSGGSGSHQQDWLNAVREGRPAGSPFDYGGRLTEIGLLGVIALRFPGRRLQYDEKAARFTDCDEANPLLDPPYRTGWDQPGNA